jgi:eukaryotic-like serine/threonine-protein kinase
MTGRTPDSFWRRVRRARLFQVLVLYLSASFVVLQAVGLFTDKLGLPDWFFPGALVLLLIGLPIILATALLQSGPADDAPDHRPVPASPESGVRELGAELLGDPARAAGGRGAVVATEAVGASRLAGVATVARDWLTWRRSILGGVVAFNALILFVGGYATMRVLGIGPVGSLVAAGVLDARERILLSEFQSPTGDRELAAVVTEAFRVDVAQSPMLTLVAPSLVQDALRRMGHTDEVLLDPALARELAVREGIKAVITGEIGAVGDGYVVSARLILPESGTELAAFRELARTSGDLIPAIDRLSNRLRERIGESLRSIRANDPLEQVTTASLDALSKYTQAVRLMQAEGDSPRAIGLLEEAIAADPDFAMAHRRLGIVLANRGEDPERMRAALRRAHDLRHRLTDAERYMAIAGYHNYVSHDEDRALEAYRNLLDLHPYDATALNNLGVTYSSRGDFERAADAYSRAIAIDSFNAFPATNIVYSLYNLGRFEEARAAYDRAVRRFPAHRLAAIAPAQFAAAEGDYDAMVEALRGGSASANDDPAFEITRLSALSAQATIRGRLGEAEDYAQQAGRLDERRRGASARIETAAVAVFHDLVFRDEPVRARSRLAAALARDPLDSMEPHERPYGLLAYFHTRAGAPDSARFYLARMDDVMRAQGSTLAMQDRPQFEAMIAIAEGRPRDAVRAIQDAKPTNCPICLLPPLGQAYELLEEPDSAIAAYQAFLETPFLFRIWQDRQWRTYTVQRLADLHELRGDNTTAARYHAALLDLWRDADPELQPQVRYAERALVRLRGER